MTAQEHREKCFGSLSLSLSLSLCRYIFLSHKQKHSLLGTILCLSTYIVLIHSLVFSVFYHFYHLSHFLCFFLSVSLSLIQKLSGETVLFVASAASGELKTGENEKLPKIASKIFPSYFVAFYWEFF